ncbi:methyltransferase domain-containing protein [Candidatus Amesbacteria bacterium]|nr:methyltransferase domain-containing protein [Candidatus Amesbacteria bacterium]
MIIKAKNYYQRFGVVLGNPFFPIYLRWAYNQGIKDVESLGKRVNFEKQDFSCLLSGCGNEQTADTFIQFVIKRNKNAKIYIIDLGKEQVKAIKKLVISKYKNFDVVVQQINALDLKKIISPKSLDWIETDGVMEFFDHKSLEKLLQVWHNLLKKDGFITTRDCVTEGKLTPMADFLRINIAYKWLGVKLYAHTKKDYIYFFRKIGFRYFIGDTLLYTYRRFALVSS